MTRKKKIWFSILGVVLVGIATFIGILFGTSLIQLKIIKLICPDKPGSYPENYAEIEANTTIETHTYKDGLEFDIIEPKGELKDDNLIYVVFHGGYYLAGGRHNQEPYAKLIAYNGYRVANVDYTLGKYPSAIKDANDCLKKLNEMYPNSRYVLTGDSAGGHLAGQLTAVYTNREYGKTILDNLSLEANQVAAFIGNCAFYEGSSLHETGFLFIDHAMKELMGDKDYLKHDTIKQLDIINYCQNFPKTLLMCGDKDGLISQNHKMFDKLKENGVDCESYFPESKDNELGHEFQCNYEIEESYIAMEKILTLLSKL